MKFAGWITAGVVGIGAWSAVCEAGPPPLDRPTPPPCCADGRCYQNPTTWGHYATRWRRWPTEYLEPLPAEARPPAPLPADIPAYETPPAEEEDRRAPPPTAPRRQPEGEDQAPTPPAAGAPSMTPPGTAPTTPPSQPPTTLPFGNPEDEPPTSPLPLDSAPPPTTLPFGEPMGEADPPPAPPFAAAARHGSPTGRAGTGTRGTPVRQRTSSSRQDDPAPAMPLAMTSWSN